MCTILYNMAWYTLYNMAWYVKYFGTLQYYNIRYQKFTALNFLPEEEPYVSDTPYLKNDHKFCIFSPTCTRQRPSPECCCLGIPFPKPAVVINCCGAQPLFYIVQITHLLPLPWSASVFSLPCALTVTRALAGITFPCNYTQHS